MPCSELPFFFTACAFTGMPRSRGLKRTQNAPTGEHVIRKTVFASASPPTMIFLRAATGERSSYDNLCQLMKDGTTADLVVCLCSSLPEHGTNGARWNSRFSQCRERLALGCHRLVVPMFKRLRYPPHHNCIVFTSCTAQKT